MKTILVPVNFSRATPHVLARAVTLARATGARLILLNVTCPAKVLSDHARLEELGERVLARGALAHGQDGRVAGETLELIGKPSSVIVEQAARLHADYIVMGARSATAQRASLGAKASRVIREARCPVVLVSAPARGAGGPAPAKIWRAVRRRTPGAPIAHVTGL